MISFEAVSKSFRIYQRPSDWLREKLLRRPYHETRHALSDISFAIEPGEVFGVIGQNGAGKSTLLKLVTGVLLPDSGAIRVDGRVTGLLELGTGFNPQFSGYDNIVFNGALLGLTPAEIEAKRADIIAFSELEEAIHYPLRTYSSGMTMRLAFAIAVHADPACMVVDEALAVGDIHFQQKCMRRLREFKASGGSILFVSHDLNAVKVLCDRALVLDKGQAVMLGAPDEAVQEYYRIIARLEGEEEAGVPSGKAENRLEMGYGTGEVRFLAAHVVGARSGAAIVESGEPVEIRLTATADCAIDDVTIGFQIHDRFGQVVYGTNTCLMGRPVEFRAGETRELVFRMAMDVIPGHYTVSAAMHRDETHMTDCFHWCDGIASFEVAGFTGPRFIGIVRLEPEFAMEPAAEVEEH